MKTQIRILALALITGGAMFAQSRLSIHVGIGGYDPGYYPPAGYAQYAPPCPGPGYTWVDGYWAPRGRSTIWIDGFWRPPVRVYRMAPRYYEPRYYNSYRGDDRGYDRGHGHGRDYRGGERFDNRRNQHYDSRGRGRSDDFRR